MEGHGNGCTHRREEHLDIKTLFKGLTNPEPNILAVKGFVHSVDWDKAENARGTCGV